MNTLKAKRGKGKGSMGEGGQPDGMDLIGKVLWVSKGAFGVGVQDYGNTFDKSKATTVGCLVLGPVEEEKPRGLWSVMSNFGQFTFALAVLLAAVRGETKVKIGVGGGVPGEVPRKEDEAITHTGPARDELSRFLPVALWRWDENSCHLDVFLATHSSVMSHTTLKAEYMGTNLGREYIAAALGHTHIDRIDVRDKLRRRVQAQKQIENRWKVADVKDHYYCFTDEEDEASEEGMFSLANARAMTGEAALTWNGMLDQVADDMRIRGQAAGVCTERHGITPASAGEVFGWHRCKWRKRRGHPVSAMAFSSNGVLTLQPEYYDWAGKLRWVESIQEALEVTLLASEEGETCQEEYGGGFPRQRCRGSFKRSVLHEGCAFVIVV
jgi:hypothetical protein